MIAKQCDKNTYAKIDKTLLCNKSPDDLLIRAGRSVGNFVMSRYHKTCVLFDKLNPRKIKFNDIFSVNEIMNLPSIDKNKKLNPYHQPKLIHQTWQKKLLSMTLSCLYYPYHISRFMFFPFILWKEMVFGIVKSISKLIGYMKYRKINKKYMKEFNALDNEALLAKKDGIIDKIMFWREKSRTRKFMISPAPYITVLILALFVPKSFSQLSGDSNDVRNIATLLNGFGPVNIEVDSGESGLKLGLLDMPPKSVLSMQYNPRSPQMLHFNDSDDVSISGRKLAYIPSLKPALFHSLGGYFYKMQDYEKSWLTSLDFARMDCDSSPIVGTIASLLNDKQITINNKKEYDLSYQELEISYSPSQNQDSYYVSDYDVVDGKRVKKGVISCKGKGDTQFSGLIAHIANNISQGSVDKLNPSTLALNY